MTYSTEYLDELATAIGRAAIEWNRVEYGTIGLAHRMAAALCSATLWDEKQTTFIALINLPLRDRIHTIKAYASLLEGPPELFNQVNLVMKEIAGPLQEERNRFFHDWWDADVNTGGATRVQFASRAKPSKAGPPEFELLGERWFGSIKEVNDFSDRLKQAYIDITKLDAEVGKLPTHVAAGIEKAKRGYIKFIMQERGYGSTSVWDLAKRWLEHEGGVPLLEVPKKTDAP